MQASRLRQREMIRVVWPHLGHSAPDGADRSLRSGRLCNQRPLPSVLARESRRAFPGLHKSLVCELPGLVGDGGERLVELERSLLRLGLLAGPGLRPRESVYVVDCRAVEFAVDLFADFGVDVAVVGDLGEEAVSAFRVERGVVRLLAEVYPSEDFPLNSRHGVRLLLWDFPDRVRCYIWYLLAILC